jgi:hypothetical protein
MITPDLLEFIRTERASQMSDADILSLLVSQGGWTKEDVTEAFRELEASLFQESPAVPLTPPPVVTPPALLTPEIAPPSPASVSETLVTPEIETQPGSVPDSEPPALVLGLPSTHTDDASDSTSETVPDITEVEAPIILPPVSPEEDFLGIFSSPTSDLPIATATASSDGVRAVEIRHIMNTPSPATPQTGEMVMADALSGHPHHDTTPPVSTASPIKFDLGKIRVAQPMSEQVEAATPSRTSLSALLEDTPKEPHTPPVVHPTHTGSLSMKRTMASDLLLHGTDSTKATSIAPTPFVASTPALETKSPSISPVSTTPVSTSHEPVGDRGSLVKKILSLMLGVLLVGGLLGGGYFVVSHFNLLGGSQQFASALASFTESSSLTYDMKSKIDVTLTSPNESAQVVQFQLSSLGSTESTTDGFGNGTHRITLEGKIASGNFALPTKAEADVTVVGSQLYFRLLSFPAGSELPEDIFKTYWIKVDLVEIAKELSLTGVAPRREEFGSFAGASSASLMSLLREHQPIVLGGQSPDDGSTKKRISYSLNPDAALAVVLSLRDGYLTDAGALSEDERARLLVALSKLKGEIEVDTITGNLTSFTILGAFDDEIFGVRTKGNIDVQFAFSGLGAPVVVEQPAQVLTLEELRVEMEAHTIKVAAERDDEIQVMRFSQVLASLQAYGASKGRYPILLSELYDAGLLSSTTVPQFVLNSYAFASYQDKDTLSRSNRCTTKGKACAFVHIGLNLLSKNSSYLAQDADNNSEIRGSDEAGCTNEKDMSCYDIVLLLGQDTQSKAQKTTGE